MITKFKPGDIVKLVNITNNSAHFDNRNAYIGRSIKLHEVNYYPDNKSYYISGHFVDDSSYIAIYRAKIKTIK
jgi:hypothetical protein